MSSPVFPRVSESESSWSVIAIRIDESVGTLENLDATAHCNNEKPRAQDKESSFLDAVCRLPKEQLVTF